MLLLLWLVGLGGGAGGLFGGGGGGVPRAEWGEDISRDVGVGTSRRQRGGTWGPLQHTLG